MEHHLWYLALSIAMIGIPIYTNTRDDDHAISKLLKRSDFFAMLFGFSFLGGIGVFLWHSSALGLLFFGVDPDVVLRMILWLLGVLLIVISVFVIYAYGMPGLPMRGYTTAEEEKGNIMSVVLFATGVGLLVLAASIGE